MSVSHTKFGVSFGLYTHESMYVTFLLSVRSNNKMNALHKLASIFHLTRDFSYYQVIATPAYLASQWEINVANV